MTNNQEVQLAIHPYKNKDGIWWIKHRYFDNDLRRKTAREKFLNGKDLFCDEVANIKGRDEFTIIYSLVKTPNTDVIIELIETGVKPKIAELETEIGCNYLAHTTNAEYINVDGMICYFCSNLIKWFPHEPPAVLYLELI